MGYLGVPLSPSDESFWHMCDCTFPARSLFDEVIRMVGRIGQREDVWRCRMMKHKKHD
jgi:hypothetical protein